MNLLVHEKDWEFVGLNLKNKRMKSKGAIVELDDNSIARMMKRLPIKKW